MDIPAPPFWGAQTSFLNFCEEDYVITRYIAEFVNTLSSLAYVAYGFHGLFSTQRAAPRTGSRLVPYAGLVGVGLCSAAYHMTLKYHTQMSDELSMHLLTTPLLYRILTFKASPHRSKLVGVILVALFFAVMVTHMVMDEFVLHAVSFGLAIGILTVRVTQLIPQQVSDPQLLKIVQTIARFGSVSFALGYFLWLIDGWACRMLTNMRHMVGLPCAFLFEFHGWWHILTALGGYVGVTVIDLITSGEIRKDPTDQFAWPVPSATRLILGAPKSIKKAFVSP